MILVHSVTSLATGVARADDDDPAKGKFTLEQATKGLTGSGPLIAKIETTLGTFNCELYDKQAPKTVATSSDWRAARAPGRTRRPASGSRRSRSTTG